jgi:hypothetical protein
MRCPAIRNRRSNTRPLVLFMTLPAYSRSKEGEGHELGFGGRNGSHTARSRPARATRESSERACPATLAQRTAGSRIPWESTQPREEKSVLSLDNNRRADQPA